MPRPINFDDKTLRLTMMMAIFIAWVFISEIEQLIMLVRTSTLILISPTEQNLC